MRFPTVILGLLLLVLPSLHADTAWYTDFAKAQAAAKAQGRPILLDFTGTDWCPPCILLDRTVYPTPEFQAYAAAKLVLMKVEVPEGGQFPKVLSDPVQKQNATLLHLYEVEMFPTLILVKADGTKIQTLDPLPCLSRAASGKIQGDPKPLFKQIDAVLASQKK